ncbi:hypothetical protein [Listeria ivanovii]|uniref:hypothetical protein n=1 Tax=Listeria ivanovii TaxID=1638 RepID=UPI0030CBB0C1
MEAFIIKKLFIMIGIIFLSFSVFSISGENVYAGNVKHGTFGIPKKGFVKSTYKGATLGGYMDIEYSDFYLNTADARTFASRLDQSNKSVVAWAAASFIPGIGPYITVFGAAASVKRGTATSAIRKLTNKNKKVHVTLCWDKRYGNVSYVVSEWSGTRASIIAFKVAAPKYRKIVTTKVTY